MIEAFGWRVTELQLGMLLGSFLTFLGLWATVLGALVLLKSKAARP